MNLKIVNVDRLNSLATGLPSEHDFSVVLDLDQKSTHLLTGKEQPVQVYSGTLAECHQFVRGKQA